jgi:capsular polysaccharide biosynthesis protein
MQLIDYITVLRRRWWVILLVAFVAAASAYAFSKLQTPIFRSEATYLVQSNRFDAGLAMQLQSTMNSYKAMALAPIQLEKISNDLKLDRSADWLLRRVYIQPQVDTSLMVIQADYPDPAQAQAIANAVGDNLVALVAERNRGVEGTDRINVLVNQPARPAFLFRPQTRINVAAGGVLGLILGLLLAFVLEALDNTLKSTRDVERFAGLTVLGAIPTVAGDRRASDDGRRPAGETPGERNERSVRPRRT